MTEEITQDTVLWDEAKKHYEINVSGGWAKGTYLVKELGAILDSEENPVGNPALRTMLTYNVNLVFGEMPDHLVRIKNIFAAENAKSLCRHIVQQLAPQ